jgi:hypothetical protein
VTRYRTQGWSRRRFTARLSPALAGLESRAERLDEHSLDVIQALRDWELAYRKERFYRGLRALLTLERDGETTL